MPDPNVPPTRYVALLRAINVGGHTVKMDRLRALFEAMGHTRVQTYIASGNVIFDAPAGDAAALEARIAGHLEGSLGFPVATFLRTPAEMRAAAEREPFGAVDAGDSLYVAFLPAPPGKDAEARLQAHASEVDDFRVHGREVYWRCRKTISQSDFSGARLEKALGMPATMRNVTTVRKLAERAAAA